MAKETIIRMRTSDRLKRLMEARALTFGLSLTEYIKQRVIAADGVLREQMYSTIPTDDLVRVPMKIAQKEAEKS